MQNVLNVLSDIVQMLSDVCFPTSLLCMSRLILRQKEKKKWSVSNGERHTLTYGAQVKWSLRICDLRKNLVLQIKSHEYKLNFTHLFKSSFTGIKLHDQFSWVARIHGWSSVRNLRGLLAHLQSLLTFVPSRHSSLSCQWSWWRG